ncbi:MAG TPA: carboxypeptidase-like regulatory domain-containing protein, partial [Gemmatimonadales bacterium]|nr:carboxypeptidase-like regulatory domain-containing protein [Gemmatimonadales bacterium]
MRSSRPVALLLFTLGWPFAAGAQNVATFSGTLVRRDSSAVAMAKIKLPLLERTATTNDSGHFELRNLPPGKHEVTVWAPGAAPVSMELVLLA